MSEDRWLKTPSSADALIECVFVIHAHPEEVDFLRRLLAAHRDAMDAAAFVAEWAARVKEAGFYETAHETFVELVERLGWYVGRLRFDPASGQAYVHDGREWIFSEP